MDYQVQANMSIFIHSCPCPSRPLSTTEYASTSSVFNNEVPPPGLTMNPTYAYASTANNSSGTISNSISHILSEKQCCHRINSHLSTLKRLIPRSDQKMDKGSLLGWVVDHLKELKRNIPYEIIQQESTIPSESDEVIVEQVEVSTTTTGATTTSVANNNNNDRGNSNNNNNKGKYNNIYLKVTVSFEDRPELFMDLIEALKGLKMLRTIRTDR